jgi:hypothetical protein
MSVKKINYDIIICVGWNDILIVKKTIKYLRLNLKGDIIYIIINRFYFNQFSTQFLKNYRVVLIDEDELIPGVNYKSLRLYLQKNRPQFPTGWYYQQFLKMGFSDSRYAKDYYLIWDADTLPLSKLEFVNEGQLLFTQKKEYHKEYFDTIETIFHIRKNSDFSFIAEHMLIKTTIMKEIINKLSESEERCWPFSLINHIQPQAYLGFSEFETYGTYVNHYYPGLYKPRMLNTWRNAGSVFGRNVKDEELKALAIDLDIVSLESWNGKFFPQNIVSRIMEFYVKFLRYKYLRSEKLHMSPRKILKMLVNHSKIITVHQ